MARIEETKRMGGWGRGIRQGIGRWGRGAMALGLALWLGLGLGGCGGSEAIVVPKPLLSMDGVIEGRNVLAGELAEVSPPVGIQRLKPFLDSYSPQVRIVSPRNGEVLSQTAVTARVRLQGLPIYRDAQGRLASHLRLFLDDRPPILLDSLKEGQGEVPLGDLTPGSHTLRVLAVRPWGESFKNEGALAQVTFQVFTASDQGVTAGIPQLIYNSPQGTVAAQPVLLDFGLRDIPLHEVAQGDGAIADWRLRCTINGQTFVFDRWQPIYLTGFKPGQNWIKLELIDETGTVFPNPLNTVLRVVDFQPQAADPLAGLFTGEEEWQGWRPLVDPSYVPPVPPSPLGGRAEETEPPQERSSEESPAVSPATVASPLPATETPPGDQPPVNLDPVDMRPGQKEADGLLPPGEGDDGAEETLEREGPRLETDRSVLEENPVPAPIPPTTLQEVPAIAPDSGLETLDNPGVGPEATLPLESQAPEGSAVTPDQGLETTATGIVAPPETENGGPEKAAVEKIAPETLEVETVDTTGDSPENQVTAQP